MDTYHIHIFVMAIAISGCFCVDEPTSLTWCQERSPGALNCTTVSVRLSHLEVKKSLVSKWKDRRKTCMFFFDTLLFLLTSGLPAVGNLHVFASGPSFNMFFLFDVSGDWGGGCLHSMHLHTCLMLSKYIVFRRCQRSLNVCTSAVYGIRPFFDTFSCSRACTCVVFRCACFSGDVARLVLAHMFDAT